MNEINLQSKINLEILDGFKKNKYFDYLYNNLLKDNTNIFELIEFGLEKLKNESNKLKNLDNLAHYFLVLSEIKKIKENVELHSFLVDVMVYCENITNIEVTVFKSIEEIENTYKNIKNYPITFL